MFEHITKAREIVKNIRDVSEKTAYKYIQRYNKIKNDGITANTSNSFYNARAAFTYGASIELSKLLTLRDKSYRANDVVEFDKCDTEIKDIIKKIDAFHKDKGSLSANLEKVKTHQALKKAGLADGDIATWTTHKQDNNITVQKHSKRNDVKFWQDEFDNIFLNEIDQKYKQWLAMMMIAGVRPDELDKNNVWFRREGNVLAIQIECSKQKPGEIRQKFRTIRIEHDPENLALDFIFKLSSEKAAQPDRPGVKNPVQAMRKVLSNIGNRLKPSAPNLSPYIYRHAFAANLKASGMSPVMIANALGHINTKTQGYYGNSKNGKSNVKVDAEATYNVNDNHHDYTPAAPEVSKVSTNVQNERPEPAKGLRSGPAAPLKSNYQISSDSGPGW
jgi:integrase